MQPRSIILATVIGVLASGSCVSPSRADDVPIPSSGRGPGFVPLVISERGDGVSSLRYRSGARFPEITKGAGTDPSAISARFYLAPADSSSEVASFLMPAGSFDGTSGWVLNDSKRARYRSKKAPLGPTFVTYSEIRPGKSLRLHADEIDDFPFLLESLEATGAYTSYCVENGGQRFCHCSTLQNCTLTTSGGRRRVECTGGISDERCHAVTRALPSFSASATVEFTNAAPESLDDDLQDVIEVMNDLGYGVTRGSFELSSTPGPLPGQQFAAAGSLSTISLPVPSSHDLVAIFDETGNEMVRLGGQDVLVAGSLITDTSNAVWSFDVSVQAIQMDEVSAPLPRAASTGASGNLVTRPLGPGDQGENGVVILSRDQQSIDDVLASLALAGFDQGRIDRAVIVPIPDVQIPDGAGSTRTAFAANDLDVPFGLFSVRRRWSARPGRTAHDRGTATESRPFYLFRKNELAPRVPVSVPDPVSPPHAGLAAAVSRNFNGLVNRVIRHFETVGGLRFVSDQPLLAMNGTESALGTAADVFEGGAQCLAGGLFCGLDDGISYYAWPGDSLTLSDSDLYLVVGLNYDRLVGLGGPMATVSLVGAYHVQDPDDPTQFFTPIADVGIVNDEDEALDQGIVPVDNIVQEPLPKRLRGLLPNSFIVQIARPATCLPPPLGGLCLGTDVLADAEPVVIAGRLQLNPVTGTKPDANQIVPWRLLHFQVTP